MCVGVWGVGGSSNHLKALNKQRLTYLEKEEILPANGPQTWTANLLSPSISRPPTTLQILDLRGSVITWDNSLKSVNQSLSLPPTAPASIYTSYWFCFSGESSLFLRKYLSLNKLPGLVWVQMVSLVYLESGSHLWANQWWEKTGICKVWQVPIWAFDHTVRARKKNIILLKNKVWRAVWRTSHTYKYVCWISHQK